MVAFAAGNAFAGLTESAVASAPKVAAMSAIRFIISSSSRMPSAHEIANRRSARRFPKHFTALTKRVSSRVCTTTEQAVHFGFIA